MSQDIIADTLNQIMNAKRAGKESVVVGRHSKLLLNVLDIAKEHGYIKSYKIGERDLEIKVGELNECHAIKPRYNVTLGKYERYLRRFLPARNMGIVIVSTSKGLKIHEQAQDENLGGALIAYFY